MLQERTVAEGIHKTKSSLGTQPRKQKPHIRQVSSKCQKALQQNIHANVL